MFQDGGDACAGGREGPHDAADGGAGAEVRGPAAAGDGVVAVARNVAGERAEADGARRGPEEDGKAAGAVGAPQAKFQGSF